MSVKEGLGGIVIVSVGILHLRLGLLCVVGHGIAIVALHVAGGQECVVGKGSIKAKTDWYLDS